MRPAGEVGEGGETGELAENELTGTVEEFSDMATSDSVMLVEIYAEPGELV